MATDERSATRADRSTRTGTTAHGHRHDHAQPVNASRALGAAFASR
jgi:hypothetical protein